MTAVLRRHRLGIGAIVCVLAAVVLLLLAMDAKSWSSTVTRDDLRFRTDPSQGFLWHPGTMLPGDPASIVIGTGSTVKWRRALQLFWFSRIGSDPETREQLPTIRAEAEQTLESLIRTAPTASERSKAANLLGVLIVATPPPGNDPSSLLTILKRGAGYFEDAIALDATNYDAKQNLEIAYRITSTKGGRFGHDARAGYGFGKGRGSTTLGSGY